jgi:RNA polymerase sigma-70 factor (ECF subfamily)
LSDAFDLDGFHAGDDSLFEQLVHVYSPRLLPVLCRYAPDDQTAHDLLQEVWLRAFQKRRTFSGRGSLLGWLLAICRTVGLAAVDRRAREVVIAADLTEANAPAMAGEYSDERELLRAAIAALPDRQRDVVLLRVVEGRSTTETARILQCAEGTVKATLHQAIRKLHDMLKEKVP